MITLNIQVTQDDILNGLPRDCNNCPIARAIERAAIEYFKLDMNKDYESVEIGPEGQPSISIIGKDGKFELIAINEYNDLIDFIERYDNSTPVEPFEIELEFVSIKLEIE